tara:strand:+ start:1810 stop:2220 length:411 start_codon:yes stop_codon:yes gene_type:complete
MEHWWLYLLVFIFGYMTHKTFYFLKSLRLSLILLRSSHVIYLSALTKALEHLSYAHETALQHLATTEKTSAQITSFKFRFDDDVKKLKTRSIDVLLELHPPFFRSTLEFEDWAGAMEHLTTHREAALAFWKDPHDK